MQNNADNIEKIDEIEINLFQMLSDLFHSLRRNGWLVLATMSVLGSIVFFVARFQYKAFYEAYTTFTVNTVSSVNYNSRVQKNTVTNKMGQVFPYILTSDALKSLVMEDMGYEEDDFPAEIMASVVQDTNLITLKVRSDEPQIAYDVLRSVLRNYPSISEVAIGDVTLKQMDESGLPTEPANKPYSKLAAIIVMTLTLIAFIAWFIFESLTRKTIRDEEELARYFNTNYLGNMPSVVFKKRSNKKKQVVALDAKGIPFSFVEAIRTIRHRVEREAQKNNVKTILVTSALQSEGKTTVSTNLAIALANRNYNVLLVDGDLRNPSVLPALGLEMTEKGMVDLLSEKCYLRDVLIPYKGHKHLFILPGGKPIDNPVSLLSGEIAELIISQLREKYEYVIIDVPPSAIVSDASILARVSDGCVYVVRQDYAGIDTLREGMDMFSGTGCKLLGCVLNHAEAGGGYGYGGYGRYGYGKYGYGKYGYGKYGYGKSGYGYGYGESTTTEEA